VSELAERIAEQVGGRVASVTPLPGGACQDNFKVELEDGRRLVLRSDSRTPLPMSRSRREEHAILDVAVRAGVRTPAARSLGQGIVRDGAWAYFLDWVDGEAIGRRVVASPKLEAARARLPVETATELAKIHSIVPKEHPRLLDAERAAAPSFDPVADALATLRTLVDGLHEPRPALELALRWLHENRPTNAANGTRAHVCLVHGDFRTGNFMVTPRGLAAVLDWEFCHWGSPAYDLSWISVRDWRFGRLALPIGGFSRREPFYEAYEKASGRALDLAELHYWEVMGNVRWATGSVGQGERYTHGGESDIELVAVGRRAAEMEFEALRLIERGRI
jgi:aminoglycoside phosphotransferase (APT) family kinase protein